MIAHRCAEYESQRFDSSLELVIFFSNLRPWHDAKTSFLIFISCSTPKNSGVFLKLADYWLETVISPAAICNLNTFPSLVKSKVVLLAIMSANGQSKSARNFHFLRRLQAGQLGGVGIRNLPPPSPTPSFPPCFTVWCLKSRYGYITHSNMLQYEV